MSQSKPIRLKPGMIIQDTFLNETKATIIEVNKDEVQFIGSKGVFWSHKNTVTKLLKEGELIVIYEPNTS